MRCIIDDKEVADEIFSRIKSFIPSIFNARDVVSVNERLRFLKYQAGDFFQQHRDGCYIRPENGERSYLTIQLYLSEGAVGGATRFLVIVLLHSSINFCNTNISYTGN